MTVNNIFCHWLIEIDARGYPDDELYQQIIQSKFINIQPNN